MDPLFSAIGGKPLGRPPTNDLSELNFDGAVHSIQQRNSFFGLVFSVHSVRYARKSLADFRA
jgi:hypothetical protein